MILIFVLILAVLAGVKGNEELRLLQACVPGQYLSAVGCTPCSIGSYAPNNGMTSCIACGTGYETDTTGATKLADCNKCADGFYSLKGVPSAGYGDGIGNSGCATCDPNASGCGSGLF